jgi:hypothetical protein
MADEPEATIVGTDDVAEAEEARAAIALTSSAAKTTFILHIEILLEFCSEFLRFVLNS